ncbi:MAG: hypothetical protein AB1422_08610 [bacterium]
MQEVKSYKLQNEICGYNKVTIEIGEICFVFRGDNYELMDLIKRKYNTFLSMKEPNFIIDVQVKKNIKLKELRELKIISKKDKIFVFRWDFSGIIDFRRNEGELKLQEIEIEGVENFLRMCAGWLFPKYYEGILLHASSVIDSKEGFVFCGPSEAGKSTIANLLKDDTILLTDEITLIRNINRRYKIFGVPFWGMLWEEGNNVNISSEIKKIFLLKKDKDVYLKKLSPYKAVVEIMPNIIFFSHRSEISNKLFTLCCNLVEKIPCYELHFLPNKSFWRCIKNDQ